MAVNPNFGIIMNAPDAGQAFSNSFERGMGMAQQHKAQNALAMYAQNPDDPQALNALLQYNPALGIRVREQNLDREQSQARVAAEKQERDIKILGGLAKGARDLDSWNRAVDIAVSMGYEDAAKYRDQFEMRDGFMSAAGIKEDDPEYITVDGVVLDKRTMQPVWESPYPRVVSGGGGVHIQPRVGLGGLRSGTSPQAGQVINAPEGLPPGWSFEDEGGPGPSDPGGF